MTFQCDGAAKATLIYKDRGIEEQVVFNNPPIQIECEPVSPCGVPGQFAFTYTTPTGAGGSFTAFGYETETLFFRGIPNPGCRDGMQWDLIADCQGVERTARSVFSCTNGQPSFTSAITFTPTGPLGDGLVVRDAEGNQIFQAPVTECNYRVSCDDQCPPGHLKCKSDHWPGYCCIPCSELAQEVGGIANLARSIR